MIDRIEELELALRQIEDWSDAYPEKIFTPLRGDALRHTGDYDTEEKRNLITRASASMARHVFRGVGKICRTALGFEKRFAPQDDLPEVVEWRGIGRMMLNSLDDWSTGTISRRIFIPPTVEAQIRRLLDDSEI